SPAARFQSTAAPPMSSPCPTNNLSPRFAVSSSPTDFPSFWTDKNLGIGYVIASHVRHSFLTVRPTRRGTSMSIPSSANGLSSWGTLSRRRLLQAAGIGMANLGIPGILLARDQARQGRRSPARKSCIFLLLCGGPSHLDTWDL